MRALARLMRKRHDTGSGPTPDTAAQRAARWLRERLERDAHAQYAWLDGGIWAGAVHGGGRDSKQAGERLTSASLVGDEVA